MVPAVALGPELRFRVARDVDLASELLLDAPQSGKQFRHSHRSDDEKVNVALRLLFTTGNGTINRRPLDGASEGSEFRLEKRDDSRRLGKQGAKVPEDRGRGVGFVVGSPAVQTPFENTARGQRLEFPLKARRRSPEMRRQFRQIPVFVRRKKGRREDLLPDRREQSIEDRRVTHSA